MLPFDNWQKIWRTDTVFQHKFFDTISNKNIMFQYEIKSEEKATVSWHIFENSYGHVDVIDEYDIDRLEETDENLVDFCMENMPELSDDTIYKDLVAQACHDIECSQDLETCYEQVQTWCEQNGCDYTTKFADDVYRLFYEYLYV